MTSSGAKTHHACRVVWMKRTLFLLLFNPRKINRRFKAKAVNFSFFIFWSLLSVGQYMYMILEVLVPLTSQTLKQLSLSLSPFQPLSPRTPAGRRHVGTMACALWQASDCVFCRRRQTDAKDSRCWGGGRRGLRGRRLSVSGDRGGSKRLGRPHTGFCRGPLVAGSPGLRSKECRTDECVVSPRWFAWSPTNRCRLPPVAVYCSARCASAVRRVLIAWLQENSLR